MAFRVTGGVSTFMESSFRVTGGVSMIMESTFRVTGGVSTLMESTFRLPYGVYHVFLMRNGARTPCHSERSERKVNEVEESSNANQKPL